MEPELKREEVNIARYSDSELKERRQDAYGDDRPTVCLPFGSGKERKEDPLCSLGAIKTE